MKLHSGTHTVEKSGNFEESKFSIEASSKAFFILSDGLYSNKILAVVRELSTNAYDSHVEAGKSNIPFDVHLPTQIEPVFSIRDYGTSMNHENCMELYTTYFRSTRNNSNDAVGCLGLGSKAPFAYSDSFTVEAYLDGKKRLYTAYKNEDGSPVFSMLDETDTDEPNGIKVSINVTSYDISRFFHEAKKVYEFFKVRPKFIGEKIHYTNPTKVLEGDSWYFDDNADSNLIIMGQIAYPLNHSQICDTETDNRASKFVEYSGGLRVFVNIGDVDITPSRESLSYSKETKINICSKVQDIINEIAQKIEQEIKTQPSLFKARQKYVQISDQCHSIKSAVESLQKSITWNDIKLFDSIAGESIDIKNKITCNLLTKGYYRKKIDTDYSVERIQFSNNYKYVIDDLNRGGISRLKQHMKEDDQNSLNCYVYKLNPNETIDNCLFYDVLGGATNQDVIITSNLPKVEYNRQSSGGTGTSGPAIQARVFNEETGYFEDCNMSVKYENAHYFTESKDSVSISSYTETSADYLAGVLSYLHDKYADEIDGMTFYLVKPSVAKNRKLDERGNWHDGRKILEKVFTHAVDKHKEDVILAHSRLPLSDQHLNRWNDALAMTKTDNEAKKIMNEHKEYCQRIDSISSEMHMIQTMAQKLDNVNPVDLSRTKTTNKFSQRFDNEMKKYPMLKFATNVWGDTDKKIVADYIDGIEKSITL